jgi:hypothetical protein
MQAAAQDLFGAPQPPVGVRPRTAPSAPGLRPNTQVGVCYPPHVGRHAATGFRWCWLFGVTPLEAVRAVLSEIGRRPDEVRVRVTYSTPDVPEVALLGHAAPSGDEGEPGAVRELAILHTGISKAEILAALAQLHAQRWRPDGPAGHALLSGAAA